MTKPITVRQALGLGGQVLRAGTPHPLLCSTQYVGLEVELEDVGLLPPMTHWAAVADGSLRGGTEFVFNGPKSGVEVYEALSELDAAIAEGGATLSWRCSTHGHFNMQDATADELKKVIVAFLFSEKLMFRLAGIHRYRNNFCPAFGFAQQQLVELSRIWSFDDQAFIQRLPRIANKYTSLNFQPLMHFGTLEFRIAEPKTQCGQLLRFVNRFLALIKFARDFAGTPMDLVDTLRRTPVAEIFPMGLPAEGVPNAAEDLDVGYKLAMDLLVMADHYHVEMQEFLNPEAAPIPAPRPQDIAAFFGDMDPHVDMRRPVPVQAAPRNHDEAAALGAAEGRFNTMTPEQRDELNRLWDTLFTQMEQRRAARENRNPQ